MKMHVFVFFLFRIIGKKNTVFRIRNPREKKVISLRTSVYDFSIVISFPFVTISKPQRKYCQSTSMLYLYHSLGTFLLKMCQSLIVYLYMHSALTRVLILITRTPEQLVGSFFLEFSYCDGRERDSDSTPPSYKSDSLVFRCSFYYFTLCLSAADNWFYTRVTSAEHERAASVPSHHGLHWSLFSQNL
jgi:hypothetical protein